ncbi:MAG TPA: hypothetical protein VG842_09890 [Sediminibacterium sp.]|nr:hypothetical protein [Sediminibacterium sp.]
MENTVWVKKNDFLYDFLIKGEKTGEMELNFSNLQSAAVFRMNGENYEIKRSGFWRTIIEVRDHKEILRLKMEPEKWYANSYTGLWGESAIKLFARNNPLAEYVISNTHQDILSYGLDTEKNKLFIRITAGEDVPALFHALLWYLFVPVANENFGNTYAFFPSW